MTSNKRKQDKDQGQKGEERPTEDPSTESVAIESPSEMKRAAARTMIEKFFYQLINGCGNSSCSNENCASSKKLDHPLSRDEAAAKALELCHGKAKLCEVLPPKQFRKSSVDVGDASDSSSNAAETPEEKSSKSKASSLEEISFLTEEKVQQLIDFSKEIGDFAPLVRVIGRVFSNWQALNVSFLKSPEEGASAAESEVPKLSDKERRQATSDEKEADETLNNISEWLASRHRVRATDLQSLYSLGEDRIENALHNAIISVSQMAEVDIRFHQEFQHNASYLNCFLIIFENHMLQSAENLEKAFPSICHTMSLLPLQAQASLTRFWSGFPAASLKKKLEGLQQLITFKVLSRQIELFLSSLNEADDITSATKLMKLVYYASIMGGELEVTSVGTSSLRELLDATDTETTGNVRDDPLAKDLGINLLDCRKPLIPFEDFYNEPLSDHLEVDRVSPIIRRRRSRIPLLS
ncbi:putative ubiquitin-protein ligase E3A [Apostichopus japonicus]|uniref:Putative ubiquitin-protein ligase E3A n=1 Tax=Stichopus japonicus TaxID=307972 RepID=A0A2G8JMC5_STIJA|nr:putative ubiquitin-protein ligase E3A [Apostichopus japonicus]